MKPTELFESVMAYIDEHIKESAEEIKRGFSRKYGLNSNAIGKVFNFVTEDTLTRYIRRRKLYFSSLELRSKPQISIAEVAFSYGFADQPAYTNAFREEFGMTPNHVRMSGYICADTRVHLEDTLFPKKTESVSFLNRVFEDIDTRGILTGYKAKYFGEFIDLCNEYDFDTDTCYAIAELAERLGVPMAALFHACFDTYIDSCTDDYYLSPDDETAINLGLSSSDELEAICKFLNCEYYDLDRFSVVAFRKQIDVETYFILQHDYGLSDDDMTPEVINAFRKGKLERKTGAKLCTN